MLYKSILFKTNHACEYVSFLWSNHMTYCAVDVDVLLLVADVSAVVQMEMKTLESWTLVPY